jgi:hypothetical protein
MEELGIEVDAKHKNYFERADLTKLEEAREFWKYRRIYKTFRAV